MGKPTVLLAAPTVIIVVFVFVKSRFEERLLLKRYPAYAEYMKRSWGVFPGVGRR